MPTKLAHSGAVLPAYRLLSSVAYRAPVPSRIFRESRAARRGAAARWEAWARQARGTGPVLWAHGASIGEHQVLEPVIGRLVRARPDLRVVLSHTSPSVVSTEPVGAVCHRDYLPWDRQPDVRRALDAARPTVVLLARSELWPEFMGELAARGIPVGIVGATLRSDSPRVGRVGRLLFRHLHERIAWVGAVSDDDARRWRRLGVDAARIQVTGDPRHDRVLERIADPGPATALRAWADGDPLLVAGSVEPSDDRVVMQALAMLRHTVQGFRGVIVPHDPTPERLQDLERRLNTGGPAVAQWSGSVADSLPPGSRTVLVTARGRLADLYIGADLAYVGGGFRRRGLHAVMEPAAVGLPVLIGPRWRGAADAARLVAAGGAVPASTAHAFATSASRLLTSRTDRDDAGLRARGVAAGGAARKSAAVVLQLLAVHPGPPPDHGG